MAVMTQTVFILGAGFNREAPEEAGVLSHNYPLVSDLTSHCFGLQRVPPGQSIEDLFANAIREKRREPIKRLCDLLMEADYYVTPRLRPDMGGGDNSYVSFFQHFAPDVLITFNYDSLAELILFGMHRWRPEDGYGVPVEAELNRHLIAPPKLPDRSATIVLHQHGALCLYPSEFRIRPDHDDGMNWIELKAQADFVFDPDSITRCFSPFERVLPTTGYDPIDGRVIAPVPNKAAGLKGVFAAAMAKKASEALRDATQIIAIGYRFNPLDKTSYDPLFRGATGATVTLVQPDATPLRNRLELEYPSLSWRALPIGFGRWASSGFSLG